MTQQLSSFDQRGFGFIAGIINFIFGIIIALLAFRLLFRLLGANASNDIVNFIYETSEPFVRPFFGIFNSSIDLGAGRFEIETLIAIIVYGVVAGLIMSIFGGRRAV